MSLESEQALLGALLLYPDTWDRIDLGPAHFEDLAHRAIFQAIADRVEAGEPVDVCTVAEALKAAGRLDEVGGFTYLGSLAQNTPGAASIRHYAATIRRHAVLRELAAVGAEIAHEAALPGAKPEELAEHAEARIGAVLAERSQREPVFLADAAKEAIAARNGRTVIRTGLIDLDRLTGGFYVGDLIIVAGRTSMGKSALALTIAENVAVQQTVLVFSLEMSRMQLAERSLAWASRNGGGTARLEVLRLLIDDTPAAGLGYIRTRARRGQRKHGLALVVVDYLQLVQAQGETREQQVSCVSRGLKALAMELELPVLAVAQLNRAPENRTSKRPLMSDLRESGGLEMDGDKVILLYRDEYYHPDSSLKGVAEAIIAKNREGRTGECHLTWLADYTRFENYAGQIQRVEPSPMRRGFDG